MNAGSLQPMSKSEAGMGLGCHRDGAGAAMGLGWGQDGARMQLQWD